MLIVAGTMIAFSAFVIPLTGETATTSETMPATLPPLQDTSLPDRVQLGFLLYNDLNISARRNTGCVTCHAHSAGFADPRSAADPVSMPVSPGSEPGKFGTRNAQTAAYATFSPPFHWDEQNKTYVGGQFWDGRANSLKDQAIGPPLNPQEMAMPSKEAVLARLAENPVYLEAFRRLYGVDLKWPQVEMVYPKFGAAIGSFEPTDEFAEFNSKYDYYVAGKIDLTPQEQLGLQLFNGKAKCSNCHSSKPPANYPHALFTDFTYDNLGLPVNPRIAGLHGVDSLPIDRGLGGRPEIAAKHPDGSQDGKFKVPTLRNIEITPPYGHNGVFATLEQIVHFYNTRDTLGEVPDATDPGFGITGWPKPEVPENVNRVELGNLGLTDEEEAAVVAFMKTLTDDAFDEKDIEHPEGEAPLRR
ncbi:methylamine utilization protein MauG [Microbulbifer sp. A4B17]|uniref:cytochrome-c peroxidase n=1 Tax=Microbulbifer sp. A4B17 TaxID=359370 RepID=UPI000D52DF2B|nr:cytochrome c peroxidase [Microbulbifer sp. A4B17]AWF80197.1 methylamine utilization protein MauG [Microbulbifer sp. A4B17]